MSVSYGIRYRGLNFITILLKGSIGVLKIRQCTKQLPRNILRNTFVKLLKRRLKNNH